MYSICGANVVLFILLLFSFHPGINIAFNQNLLGCKQLLSLTEQIFLSSAFRHCETNNDMNLILNYKISNEYLVKIMKNQPKIIRQRKQSLNKAPTETSTHFQNTQRDLKARSSSSLPKKINKSSSSMKKFGTIKQGSYLLGWGKIPTDIGSQTVPLMEATKISKNVIKYAGGEKHIVYLNSNNEAFGIGTSIFGQLGFSSNTHIQSGTPLPILEEYVIKQVYATPYCTFLITNRQQVYGCGLNNRGQLGIKTFNNALTPIKICALSKMSIVSSSTQSVKSRVMGSVGKQNKNNRIKSIALGQRCNTNQSNLLTQEFPVHEKSINSTVSTLLEDNQSIVDIQGGPYHTLVLTTKGRVFYTGNIYKKSTIINDEFTTTFSQLNLKKIGKVQKIKAGLTSIGLLSIQGNLFLLGALSQNIVCDEPYNTGISCVTDFVIGKDKISLINSLGELYFLIFCKKALKTILVNNKTGYGKFTEIIGWVDHCLIKTEDNHYYCQGSIKVDFLQKKGKKQSKDSDQMLIQCGFKNLSLSSISTIGSYALGLFQLPYVLPANIFNQENIQADLCKKQSLMNNQMAKKIQELEKQNKMLKGLIRKETDFSQQKDIKSVLKNNENDCRTANRFEISNTKVSQMARTFQSSLEIPFQELELGKQISEGGYGIIYKAVWRKTTVAVKIFKIDQSSENSIKDFISQCHAMEALRHPNIVMFLGACTKPPTFAIVLEYCEGGTLWSILQRNGQLSWNIRKKLALDTARGMNYLHQRPVPILHRDLKSLNILLDANKQVKLADFGWTKGLQNYMTGKIGTYQWMAPEVVSSHQYTEKADVFSFGIILWEIASREAPYRNIPGVQVAHDVLHKDLRPQIPKKTPEIFSSLITRCWCKNANDRPSFIEIIQALEAMQF